MLSFNDACEYVAEVFGIYVDPRDLSPFVTRGFAAFIAVPDVIWRRSEDAFELKFVDTKFFVAVENVDLFLTLLSLYGPSKVGDMMNDVEETSDVLPCADLVFGESFNWLEGYGIDVDTLNGVLGFLLMNTSYRTKVRLADPTDIMTPEPAVVLTLENGNRQSAVVSAGYMLTQAMTNWNQFKEKVRCDVHLGGAIERCLPSNRQTRRIIHCGVVSCCCDRFVMTYLERRHFPSKIWELGIPDKIMKLLNGKVDGRIKYTKDEVVSLITDVLKGSHVSDGYCVKMGDKVWVERDKSENWFQLYICGRQVLMDHKVF